MPASRGALVALGIAFGLILWYAHDTLLLVFAGVLVSLVIRAAADAMARVLRTSGPWSVWAAVVLVAIVAGVGLALLGNAAAVQLGELRDTLPAAIHSAIAQLQTTPLGVWLAGTIANVPVAVPDTTQMLVRATGILSGAFGAIAGILIVVFVGIAGAIEPDLYVDGFVRVFPEAHRARIRDVIREVNQTLRTWILARLLTMLVTGLLVTTGLSILHVPLAAALGILAGALAFIPNIGAFIAAAPAVILAFVAGPRIALAVAAMYVLVHVLDDFIVGPVVERQMVKLPPVLTLVVQVVLGIGAGAVGIMLAAPLVAAGIVIVRRFWVEDVADRATS